MKMKISDSIVNEVYTKLDSLYSHRKDKENLISVQNILIRSLKNHIREWRKKQKI